MSRPNLMLSTTARIYAMEYDGESHIKIGFSTNVLYRLTNAYYETQRVPSRVFIYTIANGNGLENYRLEKELHRLLRSLKLQVYSRSCGAGSTEIYDITAEEVGEWLIKKGAEYLGCYEWTWENHHWNEVNKEESPQ